MLCDGFYGLENFSKQKKKNFCDEHLKLVILRKKKIL